MTLPATQPRVALVTGCARRLGASLAAALAADGWIVAAHVRSTDDEVPAGCHKLAGDLDDPSVPARLVREARALGPLKLVIASAARFAPDRPETPDPALIAAMMQTNLVAPVLLGAALAEGHDGGDAGLVLIGDAKLAAPNPDFMAYTLSKQALAGYMAMAARAFAPLGIRVNMVAPALMLPSGGQSADDFAATHALNPLRRGASTGEVKAAIDFLAAAPSVTGQIIHIDGGQHFWQLARDVAFVAPASARPDAADPS
jgi:NAD(P)-dependent dehydrogenase (short-subunit alcohol dehydrogenase family)